MTDKQSQSPERFGATTHGNSSQPAASNSTSDRFKPVCFNNEVDSTSPETLGERTDSEPEKKPVEQESEQDSLICQQLESSEASSVPAVGVEIAAKRGQSHALASRQGSCDGEEKQDQSKEEPSLEIKQQEG